MKYFKKKFWFFFLPKRLRIKAYLCSHCGFFRCQRRTGNSRSCSTTSRRFCRGTLAVRSAPNWAGIVRRSRRATRRPSPWASRETWPNWWSHWGTWCSRLWRPGWRCRRPGPGRQSTLPGRPSSGECRALPCWWPCRCWTWNGPCPQRSGQSTCTRRRPVGAGSVRRRLRPWLHERVTRRSPYKNGPENKFTTH